MQCAVGSVQYAVGSREVLIVYDWMDWSAPPEISGFHCRLPTADCPLLFPSGIMRAGSVVAPIFTA